MPTIRFETRPAQPSDAPLRTAAEAAERLARGKQPLLADDEQPPFEIVNAAGSAPVLFTCDHASCALPRSLGNLGVAAADLQRHIGWDPGAAAVARGLAARFDAPVVLSRYSRLVIDCNRRPGHETSIPAVSDGSVIPGNLGLTARDAARRAEALFHPYHRAIEEILDGIRRSGRTPAYLAIHSFTPKLNGGAPRPWRVSVLWDRDPRIAAPLMEGLRRQGLVVGDNEPYSGRDHFDYSNDFHANASGLPNALVEVRSDLIDSVAGAARYTAILAGVLEDILADDALYREAR